MSPQECLALHEAVLRKPKMICRIFDRQQALEIVFYSEIPRLVPSEVQSVRLFCSYNGYYTTILTYTPRLRAKKTL